MLGHLSPHPQSNLGTQTVPTNAHGDQKQELHGVKQAEGTEHTAIKENISQDQAQQDTFSIEELQHWFLSQ